MKCARRVANTARAARRVSPQCCNTSLLARWGAAAAVVVVAVAVVVVVVVVRVEVAARRWVLLCRVSRVCRQAASRASMAAAADTDTGP